MGDKQSEGARRCADFRALLDGGRAEAALALLVSTARRARLAAEDGRTAKAAEWAGVVERCLGEWQAAVA